MSNYPLHHKKRGKGIFTGTFVIVLFVIGVVVIIRLLFPTAISGPLQSISVSFWKAKNVIVSESRDSLQLLSSKKALVERNREMEEALTQASFISFEKELLSEENIELKELLGRQAFEETILAVVLARPPVSVYDTFIIDAGEDDGVQTGDRIVVSGDIIIGTIAAAHNRTSTVKLFSAPGEVTDVNIGPENILASAEGKGGGNFTVRLPRGVGVEEGDIVTRPSISSKIFGIIEFIITDPVDPFQTILFKNPVNISEIKWVQVVTSE